MSDNNTYRKYFAIDDKYYAAVTAQLIEEGKVSWDSFYPHETFVELLKKTHAVLSGNDPRSLWVEGAYGTGKSHAALTVKSLLEASDEDVRSYFRDYGLKMDLAEQLIADKNNKNHRLITVHRIGSSSIHSDDDLIFAMQQSIEASLKEHHIENQGEASLKDAALRWLEDEANRRYMGDLIAKEKYAWNFSGKSIGDVVKILQDGDEKAVEETMRNILMVAKDAGILALRMDAQSMAKWIQTVIKANDLSAILFIWDEFTEFFLNNQNSLTGFQTLAEISATSPFYFMIVTHASEALFDSKAEERKISDRFSSRIEIKLPENMAFRLMAQAMKTTEHAELAKEWEVYRHELNDERLVMVRKIILKDVKKVGSGEKVHLDEDDMRKIVPIHPYAALVLKHISVVFSSNQRSMFDFIISNDMDAKGFKWYIDNYGPLDVDNLLTVDMLWDFFCIKGKNGLTPEVRSILGSYSIVQNDRFNDDERRVFKTVLLLQAICQNIGNVSLLRPNDRNIDLAFLGTEWAEYKAHSIADHLVKENILFKRPAGDRVEYVVALGRGDDGEMEKLKEAIRKEKPTRALVTDAGLERVLSLSKAYQNRFAVHAATAEDFTKTVNFLAQQEWSYQFPLVLTFALNDEETKKIRTSVEQCVKDKKYEELLFVDTSLSSFGEDAYNRYIESMAYGKYYQKSDVTQAYGYSQQAEECLAAWKSRIESGSFVLYNKKHPSGLRCANLQSLQEELKKIDYHVYPYGLEQYTVNEQMFSKGALAQGAGCGIEQKLEQSFKSSNPQLSLENVVSGVWHVEEYWKDPMKKSLPIVKAKLAVEEMIEKAFRESGRLRILDLFEMLRRPKFGYMPCSITAFVMGFLLKEYTNGEYFWSNGSTSTPMTVDKMKTMIADGINQAVTPNKKYKDAFLVAMSAEQSSFLKETAHIFRIRPEFCGSVEHARDHIRIAMRKMTFPLWCVKYVIDQQSKLVTDHGLIERAIDLYCGLANNGNIGGQTESDLANELGRLFLENTALGSDMEAIAKDELTVEGMIAYVQQYRDGVLLDLSREIGDNGSYIEVIKKKFNADAANWVWNTQTADEKIDRVILEYNIVRESNLSLPKCFSFQETVSEWNKRTGILKVAYEAVANLVGGLKEFLSLLYEMRKTTSLQEQDKERFYELLKKHRTAFDEFFEHQFDYFQQATESLLVNLGEEERKGVFDSLVSGHFTRSRTEYFNYVDGKIKEYMENQAKAKLKKMWLERTGTKDPRDWSNIYRTPILCMFDDESRMDAKKNLGAINEANPSSAQVEQAIAYLENAAFFDRLSSEEERNQCFIQRVAGDYAIMLGTAEEIRDYLAGHVKDTPYYWIDNQTITHCLKEKAMDEYEQKGCEQALEVIDKMEIQDLKRYLRELISDNLTVGIEILKNDKG